MPFEESPMPTATDVCAIPGAPPDTTATAVARRLLIGLTAFLALVDLFATQAILPSLVQHYRVTPAAMGFAVNASTIGMAIAGLVVAHFSRHIDRRIGIVASLALLALPTALLASAPDLATFTALRIAQGLCMSAAFTLMLAYLAEHCSAQEAAAAFAADIVRTVAFTPTMESVQVLAVIVAIRTFLSWSLAPELEGRWPWQRATPETVRSTSGSSPEQPTLRRTP
jgi:MFS family permease